MTLALPEEVPKEQQQHIKNLMLSLQQNLPCPTCAEHLTEEMEEDPIETHLGSRQKMIDWMIEIHNKVNKRTGKPTMTRDQVLEEYELAFDKFSRYGQYMAVLGENPLKSSVPCLRSNLLAAFTSVVLPSFFLAT
eukprot:TRINITY_DN19603_c0_g1_i1.p1 TRINITY_DN19603_c0_g1~~TRINITY_DN19603_c0_g1_i1.p1  ORF type:complete len:135 (-),score=34.23 TRINITY_DN19603_c0_g1_i1:112-516(-)